MFEWRRGPGQLAALRRGLGRATYIVCLPWYDLKFDTSSLSNMTQRAATGRSAGGRRKEEKAKGTRGRNASKWSQVEQMSRYCSML